MAEYINIAPREHVEKRITMEAKPGDAYSESTGRKETTKYTGTWDDMLAQATALIGGGGGSVQVTCELERLEGGIGELTVTRETYTTGSGESTGGETPEEGGSGAELGTEAAPCYSMSSTPVTVSILAHPKFAEMSDLERRALKALIDGQDTHSLIEEDASGGGYMRIFDCITSPAAQKAYEYIMRGVTEYMDVSTEATLRWRGQSNKYEHGEIVETLPGGFKSGHGRNWMCVGAGVEKNGSETWCTASFRLSGLGGWDKYLYTT